MLMPEKMVDQLSGGVSISQERLNLVLRQILCLKAIKNGIQRFPYSDLRCPFFISFYDCPQDLSMEVTFVVLHVILLFHLDQNRGSL